MEHPKSSSPLHFLTHFLTHILTGLSLCHGPALTLTTQDHTHIRVQLVVQP